MKIFNSAKNEEAKRDIILDALVEASGLTRDVIKDDSELKEALGLDSLTLLDLVMQMSDQGVIVDDKHLTNIKTVGDLIGNAKYELPK